eukprot:Skav229815  [mRNA]  locus=scaffold567:394599:404831:- [translate_table: standard]
MELEVVRYSGIPESSILSVRIGSTRRLVHLNQLERPLKFPVRPEEPTQHCCDLGTTAPAMVGMPEYTIALESPEEGETATGMEALGLGAEGSQLDDIGGLVNDNAFLVSELTSEQLSLFNNNHHVGVDCCWQLLGWLIPGGLGQFFRPFTIPTFTECAKFQCATAVVCSPPGMRKKIESMKGEVDKLKAEER